MTKKPDPYDEVLRDFGLVRVRQRAGLASLIVSAVVFLLMWLGAMLWLTSLM